MKKRYIFQFIFIFGIPKKYLFDCFHFRIKICIMAWRHEYEIHEDEANFFCNIFSKWLIILNIFPMLLLFSPPAHTVSSQTWVCLDVQIIGSSGAMFALNSSLLLLYKKLQMDGRLSRVAVERVSLDKIPASLLSSVTTYRNHNHNHSR